MARDFIERELSAEEQKAIMKLEPRKFRMGGGIVCGYFDEETHTFYEANEKGTPTGRLLNNVGPSKDKTTSTPPTSSTTRSRNDTGDEKGSSSNKKKPKEKAPSAKDNKDENKSKKKLVGVVVFIIVCAIVVLMSMKGLTGALSSLDSSDSDADSPTPTAQAEVYSVSSTPVVTSDDDEDGQESIDTIYIVQAVRDIYEGEIFDESMIQIVSIGVSDYNSLIATGVTPCKWEDVDSVVGMYATEYIQAYQYVSFSDVSSSNPISGNPWADYGDGYAVITIPVDSVNADNGSVALGAMGTLTITKSQAQTTEVIETEDEYTEETTEDEYYEESGDSEGDGEGENSEEGATVDGLTVEEGISQSYTTSTYTIENAVICDILNANGDSTYSYLAQYLSLPEVRMQTTINTLCANSEFIEAVTPCYIVVRITSAQSNAVGDTSDSSIELTLTGSVDNGSTEKSDVYNGYVEIFDIINNFDFTSLESTDDESENTDTSDDTEETEEQEAESTD